MIRENNNKVQGNSRMLRWDELWIIESKCDFQNTKPHMEWSIEKNNILVLWVYPPLYLSRSLHLLRFVCIDFLILMLIYDR